MNKYQFLRIEVKKNIATLTLNNPQKANALNKVLWFELGKAFREIDQNEDVRVCILLGDGRHFTSGIDINYLADIMERCQKIPKEKQKAFLYQTIKDMQEAISAINQCRKPVIAAVHGVCIGGGVDLIAACDMRFSTKLTVFSIMETRLGIVADMGTIQRLRFNIPDGLLKELALTSKLFRGFQAEKWGLVNKAYLTKAKLLSEVYQLAQTICSLPSYAVQGTKQSINFSRDHTVSEGLEDVAQLNSELFLTEEAKKTFGQIMVK